MKVLVCHNAYQQSGGEDRVFDLEQQLLRCHGHDVTPYAVHNDAVKEMSPAAMAAAAVWNQSTYAAVRQLLASERPDVVHVHNTLPLLSPSVYYAAAAEGVPVVQTLHNYRLACVNALLYRDGAVCEACLGAPLAWRGVLHRCYRGSRAASAVVAVTVGLHRAAGTWRRRVQAYIALTNFARQKLIAAGLDASRVFVKGNFVADDPGPGPGDRRGALFVGRLSEEKGVRTLLKAWSGIGQDIPLTIIGDGPLAPEVSRAAQATSGITWRGRLAPSDVAQAIGRASLLVVPSECYEAFPLAIVEAFAGGTPVVASGLGAATELIQDGATGRFFRVGDPEDLAAVIHEMFGQPHTLESMRRTVRTDFERKHSAEANYRTLMDIYAHVLTAGAGATALVEGHADHAAPAV